MEIKLTDQQLRQKLGLGSVNNKLWLAGRPYNPETGNRHDPHGYMPLIDRFTGMDPKEMHSEKIHSFN